MKELISREQAIEYATQAHISGCVQQRIVDLLKSVPTVESRPKGKWIDFKCSECDFEPIIKPIEIDLTSEPRLKNTYNFCPNCGADMRGEEE